MDAFEPVRISATKLHQDAVAGGADPLAAMSLVNMALRLRQIELHWLSPADPALKGARALLDEQSGTILCENVGSLGERASLVAHELGHDVLHGGSSICSATDIDVSRSTEAAPVGLQRVEDYGARERRELQANVFAREFLLPRSAVRGLFINERLGASAIAERTGLATNLVRQQLFDALLLPAQSVAEPEERAQDKPLRPDPSQDRAASHRGSAFQLQAGPGTGKTRTLVKTVLAMLAEGVDPSAILILTFSNRAAGELSERIATAAPTDAGRIWIGTFHAFGLDLVRRFHDRLGLPAEPTLFDRSDAIEVLQDILPTLPLVHHRNLWDPALVLKDIVSAISRAKDELADPAHYRSLADAMLRSAADAEDRKAAEKCLEVAHVYDLYEQAMIERGAVDFGDLIMRPALLLEANAELRATVQLRHRHVLVDEYQDVNRASTQLLKAVAGDGKRLWVVGDARQSIYRFRGASSANMVAFGREYPDSKADQLSVSYRSTREIVDVVVGIAPKMDASMGMLNLSLIADRGAGPGRPQIRSYETAEDEAAGIAASVRELEVGGVRLRDQAVLCRTNTRLNEIALALESRGIPVLHLGSLFERDEIRDLLAILSFAVGPFGDALTRVGAMPRYNLAIQDVYLATQRLRELKQPVLDALSGLADLPGLSPEGMAGLRRLAADFDNVRPESSAWEILSNYLLDRSDAVREISQYQSVAERMRGIAIWQFLNFVREQNPFGTGLPAQRVLNRVRQLVLLAEERDLRQVPAAALHLDAVRLMTVHGSKGLEFEAVHIPGLTTASFPSSFRGQRCPPPAGMIQGSEVTVAEEAKRAHEREEECLFFVAVSRARTHLILHHYHLTAGGRNRTSSRFLSWINSALIVEVIKPKTLPLPPLAPKPIPINVTRPENWHVTDSQLAAYEKCPRRYFYTHMLGLGAARQATAFSRTHDCIYELIGWLAKAKLDGDPGREAAEAAFDAIWQERGPVDHGFAAEYRRLASRLIGALMRASAGRRFRDAEPIAIDFPNGRVVVEPSEMTELSDGSVVLRRIRTGQKRSDEYDRLDYALYHLAGRARFGKRYAVEALHLVDDLVEVVTISSQKMANRQIKSAELITALNSGWFPTELDQVTCPRCPHFFICPATAKGTLTLSR
jgi:superfamily I DNA/RNA helicase